MPTTRFQNSTWLGVGYDVLRLDPLRHDSGLCRTLVTFDSWEKAGATELERPKGTRFVSGSHTHVDSHASLMSTKSDFQSKFGLKFNAKGSASRGGGKGSFSLSPSVSKLSKEARSSTQLVAHAEAIRRIGELRFDGGDAVLDELPLPSQLSDAFKKAFLDADRAGNYKALLDTFGTHFTTRVAIGGRAYRQSTIRATAYSSLSSQGVKVDVAAAGSFRKKFEADAGAGYEKNWVQKFEQQDGVVNRELDVNGGVFANTLEEWTASIKDDANAVPVEMTLRPISDLVTSSYFPDLDSIDARQRKLAKAIEAWIENGTKHPILTVTYAQSFDTKNAWTDKNSSGNHDAGWYKPITENGYFFLSFLHFNHETKGHKDPPHGLAVLVKLAGDDNPDKPYLARPEKWAKRDSRNWGGNSGRFWVAQPPRGYRTMGAIALAGSPSRSQVEDLMHNFRCVHKSLTEQAHLGQNIWYSPPTIGRTRLGVWPIQPSNGNGLEVGGFWPSSNATNKEIPAIGDDFKKHLACLSKSAIWPT